MHLWFSFFFISIISIQTYIEFHTISCLLHIPNMKENSTLTVHILSSFFSLSFSYPLANPIQISVILKISYAIPRLALYPSHLLTSSLHPSHHLSNPASPRLLPPPHTHTAFNYFYFYFSQFLFAYYNYVGLLAKRLYWLHLGLNRYYTLISAINNSRRREIYLVLAHGGIVYTYKQIWLNFLLWFTKNLSFYSQELQLPFMKLAATELVSGVSGESEQKMRNLFEKARVSFPSSIHFGLKMNLVLGCCLT